MINKSIKVIGPSGVYGGISVLGGVGNPTTGVVINAGDNDDVILRGLDITGVPGGRPLPLIGIDIQNAGAVHIEKSSISNFPEDGGACIQVGHDEDRPRLCRRQLPAPLLNGDLRER